MQAVEDGSDRAARMRWMGPIVQRVVVRGGGWVVRGAGGWGRG
jgi:hypothetical protein